MIRTNWAQEEKDVAIKFAIEQIGKKRIEKEDIELLVLELNDTFHKGEKVRNYKMVAPVISVMKKQIASGQIPTGRPDRKKNPVQEKRKESPYNPFPYNPPAESKKYSSESLNRLVSCAKDIKSKVNIFCDIVHDFADEFEADRTLMKRLKKIREAVEEFKV
jgi:hypothetical protein